LDILTNDKDLLHCGIAAADQMSWSVRYALKNKLSQRVFRPYWYSRSDAGSVHFSIHPTNVDEYPGRFLAFLTRIQSD